MCPNTFVIQHALACGSSFMVSRKLRCMRQDNQDTPGLMLLVEKRCYLQAMAMLHGNRRPDNSEATTKEPVPTGNKYRQCVCNGTNNRVMVDGQTTRDVRNVHPFKAFVCNIAVQVALGTDKCCAEYYC